jgi:hypothetical protein
MVERRVRSRDAVYALSLQPNLDVPFAEFQRPATRPWPRNSTG